jgi:hypothetical protein
LPTEKLPTKSKFPKIPTIQKTLVSLRRIYLLAQLKSQKMKIFKYLLATLTIVLLTTSLQAQKWDKDGNTSKEERTVSSFTKVSLTGGIDLTIAQGNSKTISVEASANAIDNLITEVKNGQLKIYFDKNVRRVKKAHVFITVNNLEKISANGGSDIESKGKLKFDELAIHSSGGSDIELDLEVKYLDCHTSGGSDVELAGSAETLELHASGGSDFDGFNFKTRDAKVSASGGSDSNVYASESIEVSASGASDVNFKGNPKKTKLKSSGSSDIHSYK